MIEEKIGAAFIRVEIQGAVLSANIMGRADIARSPLAGVFSACWHARIFIEFRITSGMRGSVMRQGVWHISVNCAG